MLCRRRGVERLDRREAGDTGEHLAGSGSAGVTLGAQDFLRGNQNAFLDIAASPRITTGDAGQDRDAHTGARSWVEVYVTVSAKGTALSPGKPAAVDLKVCHPVCRTVARHSTVSAEASLVEASTGPSAPKSSNATDPPAGHRASCPRNRAVIGVPCAAQTRPMVASPFSIGAISRSRAPKNVCVVLRRISGGDPPIPAREKQR